MRTTVITCDACGADVDPAEVYSVDVTHQGAQERFDIGPECADMLELGPVMFLRVESKKKPPEEPVEPVVPG